MNLSHKKACYSESEESLVYICISEESLVYICKSSTLSSIIIYSTSRFGVYLLDVGKKNKSLFFFGHFWAGDTYGQNHTCDVYAGFRCRPQVDTNRQADRPTD